MQNSIIAWATVLGLATSPAVLAAGLEGSSVTLRYDYGDEPPLIDSFVVGPGVEMRCTGGGAGNANACQRLNAADLQTLDFDAYSISYRYAGPGASFSQLALNRFNFLGLAPGFTIGGVALDSSIALLDASRVSFDGASVSVDMAGLPVADGQQFRLTLLQVPEPASAALLLGGLVLLAGARRRRP